MCGLMCILQASVVTMFTVDDGCAASDWFVDAVYLSFGMLACAVAVVKRRWPGTRQHNTAGRELKVQLW
jgi:hypothetical protein